VAIRVLSQCDSSVMPIDLLACCMARYVSTKMLATLRDCLREHHPHHIVLLYNDRVMLPLSLQLPAQTTRHIAHQPLLPIDTPVIRISMKSSSLQLPPSTLPQVIVHYDVLTPDATQVKHANSIEELYSLFHVTPQDVCFRLESHADTAPLLTNDLLIFSNQQPKHNIHVYMCAIHHTPCTVPWVLQQKILPSLQLSDICRICQRLLSHSAHHRS
jgi:hypothetical protein